MTFDPANVTLDAIEQLSEVVFGYDAVRIPTGVLCEIQATADADVSWAIRVQAQRIVVHELNQQWNQT